MKRHTLFPLALFSACILAACNPPPASNAASGTAAAASGASSASAPAGLESDTKQISYVLGSQFGKQLLEVKDNGGELDVKVLLEAVQDRFDGKEPKIKDDWEVLPPGARELKYFHQALSVLSPGVRTPADRVMSTSCALLMRFSSKKTYK